MNGKLLREKRFRYPHSALGLIVPIDHGLTMGPVEGLESTSRISRWIGHPSVTGIIAHKGTLERLIARGAIGSAGVMLHLNGMTTISPEPDRKELLTQVETAIRLGADGVSLQVNFDGRNDAHNLRMLGGVVDTAQRYSLPVLTMLYDKVKSADSGESLRRLRHLMRATMELGSDAIKIAAPARTADVPELLSGIAEDISVFFAGGALCEDASLYELTELAVAHGAAGLCVGRNVFQRPNPGETLQRLSQVLLGQALPFRKRGELRELGLN